MTAAAIVDPHMIETAVLRHPAVANCGVVGLGDPSRQIVVAGVLLKAGTAASPVLETQILATAATSLPEHERPVRVVFVEELPTVLGGAKVQREVLQQRILATEGQV